MWPGEVIKGILCFAYRRCRILVLCSDPSAAALPSLPTAALQGAIWGKLPTIRTKLVLPANLQILPYFFYRSVLLSSNCFVSLHSNSALCCKITSKVLFYNYLQFVLGAKIQILEKYYCRVFSGKMETFWGENTVCCRPEFLQAFKSTVAASSTWCTIRVSPNSLQIDPYTTVSRIFTFLLALIVSFFRYITNGSKGWMAYLKIKKAHLGQMAFSTLSTIPKMFDKMNIFAIVGYSIFFRNAFSPCMQMLARFPSEEIKMKMR